MRRSNSNSSNTQSSRDSLNQSGRAAAAQGAATPTNRAQNNSIPASHRQQQQANNRSTERTNTTNTTGNTNNSSMRRRISDTVDRSRGGAPPRAAPPPITTGAAAADHDDGEIYWRAQVRTHVYEGPFATRPVGDVEVGTVVEEVTRNVNMFDEEWVATTAEDQSVVWLQPAKLRGLTEAAVVEWERAHLASAAQQTDGEDKTEPFDTSSCPLAHPLQLLPSDAAAIGQYWIDRHKKGTGDDERDWNVEYQRLVEALVEEKNEKVGRELQDNLHQFVSEFAEFVEASVQTIISEMFIPRGQRTIPSTQSSPNNYFHNGLFFKVCVDTSAAVFGGDHNAMKFANQHLKSVINLSMTAPWHSVSVPLVAVMTALGYRVQAMTIPPVCSTETMVWGPEIGKDKTPHPFIKQILTGIAKDLNLKPHHSTVSATSATTSAAPLRPTSPNSGVSALPLEAEIHVGMDGRIYIMNTARLMPALLPLKRYQYYRPAVQGLLWRCRPELVGRFDRPTNCDCFVPGACTPVDNAEGAMLTQWIRDVGIPTVGAVLGFLEEPIMHGRSYPCVGCRKDIESELSLITCVNPEKCCRYCPQCYINLMKEWVTGKEDITEASKRVKAKCGAATRAANGLLLDPPLSTVMHNHGVNMRFLPYVLQSLPRSSRPLMSHYLHIEMVARTAKHILWRQLRSLHDPSEAQKYCKNFFLALLQPSGEQAERFWSEELGPAIQQQFDVHSAFDMEHVNRQLVYLRVSELTGVELTDESIATLDTEKPKIDVLGLHPLMKLLNVPSFSSAHSDNEGVSGLRKKDALRALRRSHVDFLKTQSADLARFHFVPEFVERATNNSAAGSGDAEQSKLPAFLQ